MSDQEQKTAGVELFLNGSDAADNKYARTLHGLFPRDLSPAPAPDFVELRRKVLQARNERRIARLRSLRWKLPVLAAAASVMVALGVRYVMQNGAPAEVIAHRTDAPLRMHSASHLGSVSVFYREADGVQTTVNDKNLTITASALTALFTFSPNDSVRRLTILTPQAQVTVIGTEFIVDSGRDTLHVAVKTGKVEVRIAGQNYYVGAGESLNHGGRQGPVQISASGRHGAELFANFRNPSDEKKTDAATPASGGEPSSAKPARSVTLTLENGTTIRGFLEYEDKESVRLRVPATGQVLTFMKTDILERH